MRQAFLFLCLMLSAVVFGQPLDTLYERGSDSKSAILQLANGDYITANNKNTELSRLQYTKIDPSGTIVDTLDIDYPDTLVALMQCPRCLAEKNGFIYTSFTEFFSSDSARIRLLKIDNSTFDTTLTTTYLHNPQTHFGHQSWSMEFDSDSTFILSGNAARMISATTAKYDLMLAKFDANFHLLWETYVQDTVIGRLAGPQGMDILIDSFGKILVTGTAYQFPFVGYEIAFAARFDSDGNNLWYREYNDSLGAAGIFCVDNGNGTYQYVHNRWVESTGSVNDLYVGRMDTLGNLLTENRLGLRNRAQFAQDIIKTLDGNYYVSGVGYFGNHYSYGLKFTGTGDSLWYRNYYHDDTLDESYVESFFQDGDSNLVHIGYHINLVNPNRGNTVFSWLYRTDRHGCLFNNCDLSVEEFNALPPLALYPNPAQGHFYLDLPAGEKATLLALYNLQGALVETHTLDVPPGDTVSISSPLPSGSYICVLRGEGKPLGVARIMLTP